MSFDKHLADTARRLRAGASSPGPSADLHDHVMRRVRAEATPARMRPAAGRYAIPIVGAGVLAVATATIWMNFARQNQTTMPGTGRAPVRIPLPPLAGLSQAEIAALPAGKVALAARAAVDKAQTWHLEGWTETAEGRKPWDMWGRKSPFLLREQLGDQTTFDDGKQRIVILPNNTNGLAGAYHLNETMAQIAKPLQASKSLPPLTVVLRSSSTRSWNTAVPTSSLAYIMLPDAPSMVPQVSKPQTIHVTSSRNGVISTRTETLPAYAEDVYLWFGSSKTLEVRDETGSDGKGLKVISQNPVGGSQRATSERLLIDSRTNLPVADSALRSTSAPAPLPPAQRIPLDEVECTLTAHYNIPVPASVTTPPTVSNLPIVDMQSIGYWHFRGPQVTAYDVMQDAAGDIRASLRVQLPDSVVNDPVLSRYYRIAIPKPIYGSDENGGLYLLTMMQEGSNLGEVVVWLAPLTPTAPGRPRPTTLTLHSSVQILSHGPEQTGYNDLMYRGAPSTVDVLLPKGVAPLPLPGPGTWNYPGPDHYSLTELADVARAEYYSHVSRPDEDPILSPIDDPMRQNFIGRRGSASTPPPTPEDRRLSANWWSAAAAAAVATGDMENQHKYQARADRALGKRRPLSPLKAADSPHPNLP